ncbi:MAG: hypothetical protein JRJ87_28010, partial [Deltaproteobacteria bacterium]|nr:hypothetical protein [Deltaproteobacteria bacterium]
MTKKLTVLVIACLVAMLFLVACGKEEESQSTGVEPVHGEKAGQPASAELRQTQVEEIVRPSQMKMTTDIPASITTPDKVETRIGTLEFFDGFPTEATAQKCFDNLDFLRGVEAFMNGCPGASLVAMRAGMREIGAVNGTISITETLMDSKSLFLT